MEVLTKLYSAGLQKTRQDLLLSSLNTQLTMPDPALRLLFPDMSGPSPPQMPHSQNPWHQLLLQRAAAVWMQQQKDFVKMNSLFENPLSILSPHPTSPPYPSWNLATQSPPATSKISFSIDNIITGRYEESRKPVTRPGVMEHPHSPLSCSSSSSSSADPVTGLKYECETCGKTYATFSGFTKHKQYYCTPQSKKQFNCKHCTKTYISLGALKMHIRTHTLPCKCKLCGKAFSRPWLLQGHMRTHTGEKPFKCQYCGRAFADRSNLRAHLQTHSDIKKYSCKKCDKTFSRMNLLVKHEESACTMDSSAASVVTPFSS